MTAATERHKLRPRWLNYEHRSAALLLFPVMAVLFIVAVFPIVYSFYVSLFDINLTRPMSQPFVGLANYVDLFGSREFWRITGKTVYFTVLSVTVIAVLSVLIALLLNEKFRGQPLLMAILLVPWAIPTVANGLMWRWIYNGEFGALNGILYQLGLIDQYMTWLADPSKAIPLIANAFIWREMPLAVILVLVSMKAINEDNYKAATVDGANVVQRFFHVTLPAIQPGLMLVFIYESMLAIRHFDLFFLLTQGGPSNASHVVAWEIFEDTFRNLNFGSGAALSYIMALATFVIAYFFIKTLGRRLLT